ncbi:extracellular catalytic domain type 1 short-chain-length polyhydroxyalkanoate depolymerase [Paracoccus liaowanqingii]|nr:PHB depolymerase family esterase [Paracoccus liaowanqingii]
MTKPIQMNMAEITRLMRAGQLSEATQMIQTGLGSGGIGAAPDAAPGAGAGASAPDLPDMQALLSNLRLPGMGGGGLTGGLPGGLAGGLSGGLTGGFGAGLPGARASGPAPVLPEGAEWTWRRHQAAGETRDLRLYVPASLAGEPAAGLLLLLHGCTQDPDDFARGTGILEAAEQHRVIVIAPKQPSQANMNRCWNWFEARHGGTDSGEAAFLADLTRTIAHEFAVPPDLRFAAGLSAGGAMAVTLGAVFADDFGAVACHSGLPNGAARDMSGAFQAMSQGGSDRGTGVGCRLFVLHGSTDGTVSPRNGDAVLSQALHRQEGLQRRAADAKLDGRNVQIGRYRNATGELRIESWRVEGLGHAWSGGNPQGSHTATGPSATQAMLKFFLD